MPTDVPDASGKKRKTPKVRNRITGTATIKIADARHMTCSMCDGKAYDQAAQCTAPKTIATINAMPSARLTSPLL